MAMSIPRDTSRGWLGISRCFLAVSFALLSGPRSSAHVVNQIYGELKQADPWEIEILFDAGYAVSEWRGDTKNPPPTREWLVNLGQKRWAELQTEADRYLHECLKISVAGNEIAWSSHFVDFETVPPDFPNLLTGGAYFRIQLKCPIPPPGNAILHWQGGTRPSLVLKVGNDKASYLTLDPGKSTPIPGSSLEVVGNRPWIESFKQGFLHVLPKGLDHVLFVLGLFLYHRSWRPLLLQSLAFTIAHTMTLGLASAGVVKPQGQWVEPMIAISLVGIACENLRSKPTASVSSVRLAVIFAFGLIHGLGFAGALSLWLTPGDGFLPSLISANLGVEVAQVTLLAVAWFLTVGWHQTPAYIRVRCVSCIGIAITGAIWAILRIA